MNDKDKEAFEKWWMEGFKGMSDIDVIKYKDVGKQTSLNGWQAACEYKQKEIDELINASKLEFDKWYSNGMRKDFFEEKRAYDLYYNYTKDVCTYRNLASVKEKNDALNLADSYKLLLERYQAENAKLRECVELIAGDQEFYCEVGDHNKQSVARQVLKELEEK